MTCLHLIPAATLLALLSAGLAAAQSEGPAGEPAAGSTTETKSAEPRDLFYRDLDYGSASQLNPLTVWLNGAYDIFRDYAYQSNVLKVDYRTGVENVWSNITHPIARVRSRGVNDFIAHEVFPFRSLAQEHGQFVPNYLSHLFGEAMLYRELGEWYRHQGAPTPDLLGAATIALMQYANEVVENGSYRGNNTDPIADLCFFNPAGLILFSIDAVAEAFAGPLRLDYWPGQAVLDMREGYLFNSGENFALKVPLGGWTRVRGFFYYSMEGLFGASVLVPILGAGQ